MESALRREEMQVEKYIKLSICFCFLLLPFSPPFLQGWLLPLNWQILRSPFCLCIHKILTTSKSSFAWKRPLSFLSKTKIKKKGVRGGGKKPHLFLFHQIKWHFKICSGVKAVSGVAFFINEDFI